MDPVLQINLRIINLILLIRFIIHMMDVNNKIKFRQIITNNYNINYLYLQQINWSCKQVWVILIIKQGMIIALKTYQVSIDLCM